MCLTSAKRKGVICLHKKSVIITKRNIRPHRLISISSKVESINKLTAWDSAKCESDKHTIHTNIDVIPNGLLSAMSYVVVHSIRPFVFVSPYLHSLYLLPWISNLYCCLQSVCKASYVLRVLVSLWLYLHQSLVCQVLVIYWHFICPWYVHTINYLIICLSPPP